MVDTNKNDKNPDLEDQNAELGNISVSKDVVAIIVAMEATKVKGVIGLTAGRKGNFAPLLDKNNLTKGIEVSMNQKDVAITISLVADYAIGIYQTAVETQKNVKKAIETMAGLKVSKVDINVLDVKFKEDMEKKEKPEIKKEIKEEKEKEDKKNLEKNN
ncbi:MAG: Asp23/Gls24 family envelope stress response protein [Atribacterota bacterium]|jgi:uncharacterized alkaline shock family protein YloU|nr:Asp23/Gls24 family envelope stress response protein [Atribacterota bacterium]MDD3641574.1 Asp23/Gls24 family envelope stress response protein [Atribacterota bacterium]MDD4288115.1 Asp23/Gls24 family envelope stress response protein [Atribacterota bacterium]MDD4764860.1 Asp23/Gls24 family envelope stress response protein [Atribacterota bacterium]MDI9597581.1 Asp23/Gls24 family envelope stress response protein [Atribacterota bacterium]